jgi:hypothetical protein
MTSSPACWAAFGRVLAREYNDATLMPVHRLTVDTWAVQHPGDGSRRAIQSVGLHLARLMIQIEQRLEGEAANRAMLGFAARKALLPALPPPPRFRVNVADVVGAVAPDAHVAAVRPWAASTWEDWREQHDFIRRWAGAEG